jgi:hypothetical protein
MHLLAYTSLFRELARRHVDIAATPENGRFVRIFISADPVQKQMDLSEFFSFLSDRMRLKPGEACLICENYQVDYDDNNGDYYSRKCDGAFLVLRQVEPDNHNARDAAVDACERIAEEVLAAAIEQLREVHHAYVSVGDAWAEHIGPIGDGHVGVRLNLAWKEPATSALTFNPTKFSN